MAQPLTKHSREGVRYTRPPAVESNIDGALDQDTSVLTRRARAERASPDYLTSECLVHLIRAAVRCGDESRYNALLPILFARCEAILERKVCDSVPNAEQIREDVLSELGMLFANEGGSEGSDELDYYECRFNHAFRTLRCGVVRRELDSLDQSVALSDGSDTEDGGGCNVPPYRAAQEDGFRLAELLDALPPDERRVVVLTDMGYDAESDDPDKITVATLCGVTGRTVRARLTRARNQIQRMLQEEV